MKTLRRFLLTLSFLLTGLFMFHAMADEPLDNPPPPPGGGHGGGGNSQGAPIDGGLSILLALGAGYGGFKLYKKKKEDNKAEESD
jgi:hypothetical protein